MNPEVTSFGYMPISLAPAHELDTLNTVVKQCMAISAHFNQEYTVITVDQPLYPKLMELKKWCIPEYQKKPFPSFRWFTYVNALSEDNWETREWFRLKRRIGGK